MLTHPEFPDLVLHTDADLGAALGAPVAERETVHAWPLSCVQSVRLVDDRRFAYKSQLPPTVEPEFYARATSPLLVGHRSLGDLGGCATAALDWVDAPLLSAVATDAADLAAHGRRIVEQIGEIRGDLPVHVDVGGAQAWRATTDAVLDKLAKLIGSGTFALLDLRTVERLRAFAAAPAVVAAVSAAPRVTHGDLTATQVFCTEGGYRLIDWQRPVLGPPEADLVALLVSSDVDPRPYVAPPVIGVFWFLHLGWAVEAQHDIFPDGRWPLFDRWAAVSAARILV